MLILHWFAKTESLRYIGTQANSKKSFFFFRLVPGVLNLYQFSVNRAYAETVFFYQSWVKTVVEGSIFVLFVGVMLCIDLLCL